MARDTSPRGRRCRRLGLALSQLTGKHPDKDPVVRRPYPPGQHGPGSMRKPSEFGLQLQEKQKLKLYYGILETQCRRAFLEARRTKGATGQQLIVLLEGRIDALILRAGLATSIRQARQFVNHGYVRVNGKRVDIPSYRVRPGSEVTFSAAHGKLDAVASAYDRMRDRPVPAYLQRNPDALGFKLTRQPERSEIPVEVVESFIVEYYAQRT